MKIENKEQFNEFKINWNEKFEKLMYEISAVRSKKNKLVVLPEEFPIIERNVICMWNSMEKYIFND